MEKAISIVIDNAKQSIADAINGSQLPPCLLEPILKEFYLEIKQAADKELLEAREKEGQNVDGTE